MALWPMGARRERHFIILSETAQEIRPSRDDNLSILPRRQEGEGSLAVSLQARQKTARLPLRPDEGSEREDFAERCREIAHDTQGGRGISRRNERSQTVH